MLIVVESDSLDGIIILRSESCVMIGKQSERKRYDSVWYNQHKAQKLERSADYLEILHFSMKNQPDIQCNEKRSKYDLCKTPEHI